MNILILGNGGREHALAWKMQQSPLCKQLFIAPGNAGTSQFGLNVSINPTDFIAIGKFCIDENIGIVVVGPEEPLVKGISDYLRSIPQLAQLIVVGPTAAAAQLEGSKAFSKHFMQRNNIPTAAYAEFDEYNFDKGIDYLREHALPVVLKADGLAAGKGVLICTDHQQAIDAFTAMIKGKQFGEASAKVVVEQFLDGIEISVFVLTDGRQYKVIGHAKDYKRIGEGDTGLNTGGMGCVSPVPFANEIFMQKVDERIIQPTVKGLHYEGLPYQGFIFFGLIKVNNEPFVIEYNCRLGDPETEVVLPRLQNDLVALFIAMHHGTLGDVYITFDERACCSMMAVSGGYPGNYEKHKVITGANESDDSAIIFHAGTTSINDEVLSNGGRVLAITAFGNNISDAAQRALLAMQKISFEGMYYRKDIGYEFK